jgi:hypothetical protein
MRPEGCGKLKKKKNHLIGSRTSNLPACSCLNHCPITCPQLNTIISEKLFKPQKYHVKFVLLVKGKVMLSLCLITQFAKKTYEGMKGGIALPFLTTDLDGGNGSASQPGYFTPGERAHSTHCIGGWLDPRASLEAMEKTKIFYPCRDRTPAVHLIDRLSCLGSCSYTSVVRKSSISQTSMFSRFQGLDFIETLDTKS